MAVYKGLKHKGFVSVISFTSFCPAVSALYLTYLFQWHRASLQHRSASALLLGGRIGPQPPRGMLLKGEIHDYDSSDIRVHWTADDKRGSV